MGFTAFSVALVACWLYLLHASYKLLPNQKFAPGRTHKNGAYIDTSGVKWLACGAPHNHSCLDHVKASHPMPALHSTCQEFTNDMLYEAVLYVPGTLYMTGATYYTINTGREAWEVATYVLYTGADPKQGGPYTIGV